MKLVQKRPLAMILGSSRLVVLKRYLRAARGRPREGTGLGLSVARGIVREHRSFMNAEREPRRGTAFAIYLPRGADA